MAVIEQGEGFYIIDGEPVEVEVGQVVAYSDKKKMERHATLAAMERRLKTVNRKRWSERRKERRALK